MQCFRTEKQSGRRRRKKKTIFSGGSLKSIGSRVRMLETISQLHQFIGWMTLGKLLNFSVFQFGHLENENNSCED